MTRTDRQHDSNDIASLQEELAHFRAEKEKIRTVIGEIGGQQSVRRDRVVNILFVALLLGLVGMDVLRHYFGQLTWFPPLISLEVGVLLVSLKIIWMIHKQSRVEHFQFWILNSIEFRLNEISRRMETIHKQIDDREEALTDPRNDRT